MYAIRSYYVLAFRRGTDEERQFWRRVLEDLDQTDEDLSRAQALMVRHGSLDDTVKRARHYGDRARDALAIFPESPMKSALLDIVDFCVITSYSIHYTKLYDTSEPISVKCRFSSNVNNRFASLLWA